MFGDTCQPQCMGLDEADGHCVMEAIYLECCTCGDLRDTFAGGTVAQGFRYGRGINLKPHV